MVGKQFNPLEKIKILQLRDQLDFYFGDSNLLTDKFLREKLRQSTQVDLGVFLTFNRVKAILGGNNVEEENLSLLRQAVGKSRMLKLSKDGIKVKRRIPFDPKSVDRSSIDSATIYVENFPEQLTHRELAKIFARAGAIRNVCMPKFKDNMTSKGFAFVEFATEKGA